MVNQPPTDTPFGLEPNVAAGLAYLLGIIGGIVMLVGGGTNKFVKWAACQSITFGAVIIVYYIAITILDMILTIAHLWPLIPIVGLVTMIVGLLILVVWLWTFIMAFQGKEVQVPVIAGLTNQFFGSQLG
jgi:uncharacterized membrane protein